MSALCEQRWRTWMFKPVTRSGASGVRWSETINYETGFHRLEQGPCQFRRRLLAVSGGPKVNRGIPGRGNAEQVVSSR